MSSHAGLLPFRSQELLNFYKRYELYVNLLIKYFVLCIICSNFVAIKGGLTVVGGIPYMDGFLKIDS